MEKNISTNMRHFRIIVYTFTYVHSTYKLQYSFIDGHGWITDLKHIFHVLRICCSKCFYDCHKWNYDLKPFGDGCIVPNGLYNRHI